MKKEVVLAIIIGFGIGLIITYGIYTAQTAIKNRTSGSDDTQIAAEDSETKQGHTVHIVSPETETVSSEEEITISGTTTPNSYLVVLTSGNQYITQADGSGSFAGKITLEAGANFVNVTSISPDGTKASSQTTISYTTASLTKDKQSSESAKIEPNEDN